jgi:drug/metabolite transporter (DMT)-like permease
MTGVFFIFLSAFGFGIMPIFALFAYQNGVNVSTLLFLRFAISALCFFAYLTLRRIPVRVSTHDLAGLFFMGSVLYALQSTLYFSAVHYIPASLAALLLYLYPVIVAFLSVMVDKEVWSWKIVAPALVSLIGIAVVLGTPIDSPDWFGVALALAAALVYSIYIIVGRRILAAVSPVVTSAYISAFAAVSFLLYGEVSHSLVFELPTQAWWVIAGVVLFSTILAMASFFAGMEIVGPTRASILSTVEPVFAIGFSALLLGETLSWGQGGGALLVIFGTVWVISQRAPS